MRTSKEERADLRARCRAGVIAITTDAALVAALLDDVEELEAMADLAARRWAIAASEASGLRSELAAARAAMPTAEEYKRVADAFEGELMEAPKARREWLAAGAAWLDRMHAYHAAHPAASPAAEVAAAFGSAPDLPEPCAVCSEALCECGRWPCAVCLGTPCGCGTGRAGEGGHE